MTLNQVESLNGVIPLVLRYFTELDSFGGRLRHSGRNRRIMSAEYRLPLLAKPDLPCSTVSLRELGLYRLFLCAFKEILWLF